MANVTSSSSIDDQQERHFIGDLLSEEDVFGQPNSTRIESSPNSGLPATNVNVLPSSGVLGPIPNQTFWPEPPPPYSPYTTTLNGTSCTSSTSSISSSQWQSSVNHQQQRLHHQTNAIAASIPPPPHIAALYGQSPTATAVTRTDFYQVPFNGAAEWDPVTGAPIDAYFQLGSGISYSPHTGMPMIKPMIANGNGMGQVQHHYHQNLYHHHTLINSHHYNTSSNLITGVPPPAACPPPQIAALALAAAHPNNNPATANHNYAASQSVDPSALISMHHTKMNAAGAVLSSTTPFSKHSQNNHPQAYNELSGMSRVVERVDNEQVAINAKSNNNATVNISSTPLALNTNNKSYRDAASRKQQQQRGAVQANSAAAQLNLRFASSNNGNSSSTNAQNMVARRVNSSQRTSSERQSVASDSVVDYLVNHHTTLLSSSDNNHHKSSSIVNSSIHNNNANNCTNSNNDANNSAFNNTITADIDKSPNAYAKRVTENEFQKITHKKNKGCKGNKNEQIILDEDGISGNQAVDASSRFDILQSLGSQSATTLLHHHPNIPLSRRSRSSGVSQRDTQGGAASNKSSLKASFSSSTQQDSQSMKGNSLTSQMFDEETNSEEIRHTSNINKVPSTLSQRSVAKKILFGNRREYNDQNDSSQRASITRKQRAAARKRQNTAFDYLHLILLAIFSLLKRAAQWITDLVVDISLQLRDITVYAALSSYTSVTLCCQRSWYSSWDRLRLLWNSLRSLNAKKLWSSRENERGEWGLSDNIQLPTTGDEAMERLLRCHGQDAYVVLGLRADCADDDIKRYYKRQAVLVHPDKNHSSGADEAFKILSRAFDAIGTPEARNKYNLANLHKNPLHKEMEELWERLREKMNEARNTMHCDCGKKHARIPVEGCRASEARYCKKCRVRHPAKHNDIWAETRCGGLWWVYYACLDGIVYDITQWAACPNNRLKHMKANSHTVQYRLISTTGSSVNKSDPSSKHNKKSGHHHHQQQQQHEFSDLDYMNSDIFGGAKSSEIRCGCSSTMQMGYNDRCGACYGSSHEKTIGINANACCAAAGIASPCSSSHAHSQQASYRPPDRRALDGDRPRRAGRRRKVR